ncbi:LysE family transporter [Vibrio sp. OCN044]|uniref:LysE family transporter n=1 Tax=Vibrio tetraodonis subsp. pristinus TaxID=2695891 RepID=A0A6L8M0N8_9VIBR|nr:LysE family transporter [Vibrio tetraodonis]MYM60916.1 LysE family transporter [Vibrio tetraodonis subsp. pristinus]
MMTSYALLVSLGIMSPGPGFVHTATHSINASKWSTFKVVFGLATANLLISTVGSLGLGSFLSEPRVRTLITITGCIYLTFVAYKLLVSSQKSPTGINKEASFISSFMIQISNIKAILFITSAVTISMNTAHSLQMTILFPIITFSISFIWYGFVGIIFQVQKFSDFLKTKVWIINKIASFVIIYMIIRLISSETFVF